MTKVFKSAVAVMLVALMSFTLLSGCSSPSNNASPGVTPTASTQASTEVSPVSQPSTEPVTINILSSYTDLEKIYQALKEGYEKTHSNVTINYDLKSGSDYQQILATMIQAGEAPDLFSHTGITDSLLTSMARNGNAVPLDEKFDKTQYPDWLLNMFTVDGKVYSIPGLVEDSMFVFYNKAVFDKYGLTAPKTQDDFVKICDTLVKNSVTPITLPSKNSFDLLMTYAVFIQSYAADWNSNFPYNGKQFTDPDFVAATKLYADWLKKGYFGKDYKALDPNASVAQMLQGKAAMFFDGGWYGSNFNDSPDIEALVLKRPDGSDAGISSPKQSATLAVCSKSKNVDVAVDAAKYFASPEMQQIMANNGDCVPGTFPAASSITSPNRFMSAISKRNHTEMSFCDTEGFIPKDGVDWWGGVNGDLQKLTYGELSPEDFCASMNQYFDFSKAKK